MARTSPSQLGATGAPRGPSAAPRSSSSQQGATRGVRTGALQAPDLAQAIAMAALLEVRTLVIPEAVPDLTTDVESLSEELYVSEQHLRVLLLHLLTTMKAPLPALLQAEAVQADPEWDIPLGGAFG